MKTKPDEYAQTRRVLDILHFLGRDTRAKSLLQIKHDLRSEVSERTIYRDIGFLREMGYKIECERNQGYYLKDWDDLRLLENKLRKSRKAYKKIGGQ